MILNSIDLGKSYKEKRVLKGVSFQVQEGEVHAILGKNGAGKSTFIKIALGLIYPTDGNITIYGKKPGISNSRVGYLSENITIYPHLSAKDNLKVAAYSANTKLSKEQIDTILRKVNLEDVNNKSASSFSLGMKRRLQLAMTTMVKKVDFLILDEPTNGLDINGLIWLKEFMNGLREDGVSILLASHAISDLQECITNYSIIDKGIIASQGNWCEEKHDATGFEIMVLPNMLDSVFNTIRNEDSSVSPDGRNHINWKTDRSYKEVCEFLYKNNIFPENVCEKKKSLQALFLETIKENEK